MGNDYWDLGSTVIKLITLSKQASTLLVQEFLTKSSAMVQC